MPSNMLARSCYGDYRRMHEDARPMGIRLRDARLSVLSDGLVIIVVAVVVVAAVELL